MNNHEKPIIAIIERKNKLKERQDQGNLITNILMPDFNLKNANGDTPLSYALEKGYIF